MPVLHPIVQAAALLTSGSGTPKEKLVLGGKLIWIARAIRGDWTPDLLERANRIYHGLLQGSTLKKAVEEMDDSAANKCLTQLTKDTVELAAEFELVRSQGRQHK